MLHRKILERERRSESLSLYLRLDIKFKCRREFQGTEKRHVHTCAPLLNVIPSCGPDNPPRRQFADRRRYVRLAPLRDSNLRKTRRARRTYGPISRGEGSPPLTLSLSLLRNFARARRRAKGRIFRESRPGISRTSRARNINLFGCDSDALSLSPPSLSLFLPLSLSLSQSSSRRQRNARGRRIGRG